MRKFGQIVLVISGLLAPQVSQAQFGAPFGVQPAKPTGPALAVFELNEALTERPGTTSSMLSLTEADSLFSTLERMRAAADDADVKGVVLVVNGGSVGYGQMEEVLGAIRQLREAGKPVYAHANSLTTVTFALLSGASRLSVAPTGDVWVTGMYSEGMYLRGLLDWAGVEPDFITSGDYKSAAEMFTRKGPSPAAEEMQNWLFDSLFESLVDTIAKNRSVETEVAQGWINQGLFSAESAKEAGLIDAVEHRQTFADLLAEEFDNARLDKSYGKEDEGPSLDLSNPLAAMSLLMGQPAAMPEPSKDKVAVVYVDGPIMLGEPQSSPLGSAAAAYSEPIRRALDEVAGDDEVMAVVLRVNSPGGSAVASEVILNAAKRVAAEKPMVVSMGDVAGSGGYYVSCGCDTIFADNMTLTGSIGVVSGKLATTNMWGRVGINFHATQRGDNADLLSSSTRFSDAQRELMGHWMGEVYDVFKGHVVAIRGDRLAKPIDELAGGRVFTGQQALELGLVDRIGTLDDAIRYVAAAAELDDYEVEVVPQAKGMLEQLIASFTGGSDEDPNRLSMPAESVAPSAGLLEQLLPVLGSADPRRVRMLEAALRQLDIVQQERVMLTMPLYDLRP